MGLVLAFKYIYIHIYICVWAMLFCLCSAIVGSACMMCHLLALRVGGVSCVLGVVMVFGCLSKLCFFMLAFLLFPNCFLVWPCDFRIDFHY